MFTVYLVTNLVNEKAYVGQTSKTGVQRFQEHCWGSNKKDYFHYAIEKHGKHSFQVQELGHYLTREEVNTAERTWILLLRSWDRNIGYNSTFGGEHGAIPNEQTRQKIGLATSKRRHTPETRKQMSESHSGEKNHFFGKKHEPESIEVMREKLKAKLSGEGNYWFGKTLSDEHRANLSKAKKGVKKTKPMSEETRQKLRELATLRWGTIKANPDAPKTIGKPARKVA